MRWLFFFLPLFLFSGESSDSIFLTISVDIINKLSFSDTTPSIVASNFTQTSITGENAVTSYGVITNDSHQKRITATIDNPYPDDIVLKLTLAADVGWISYPLQKITANVAALLLDKITPNSNVGSLPVIYDIEAPRMTPHNTSPYSRRITYTLSDE